MKLFNTNSFWLMLGLGIGTLFILCACQSAPAATPEPTIIATSSLAPSPSPSSKPDATADCSAVERLPNDSVEAQQILEEFIQNFKKQQPTEYMGMAILDRVDRLGEWAVVQGSVSGDDRNILVVHHISGGYQLVGEYLVVPSMAEHEEWNRRITQHFFEKLPDAPRAAHLPGADKTMRQFRCYRWRASACSVTALSDRTGQYTLHQE